LAPLLPVMSSDAVGVGGKVVFGMVAGTGVLCSEDA
jgi:hypothetical protein